MVKRDEESELQHCRFEFFLQVGTSLKEGLPLWREDQDAVPVLGNTVLLSVEGATPKPR